MIGLRFVPCLALVAAALAPGAVRATVGVAVGQTATPPVWESVHVVLVRDGTRTVVTLQPRVQGPTPDFALILAVPASVPRGGVRMVPRGVPERLERFTAPRLVESHALDPCPQGESPTPRQRSAGGASAAAATAPQPSASAGPGPGAEAWTIELFPEAGALLSWLQAQRYIVPTAVDEAVRLGPEPGMQFMAVRVRGESLVADPDGRARLSALRFVHDSEAFTLPLRLDLPGEQDLLVHTVARGARYEPVQARNVAAPTDLEVLEATGLGFTGSYAAVFDGVRTTHPGVVVTEYAGAADACGSCTGAPLTARELQLLGGEDLAAPTSLGPGDAVVSRLHTRLDTRFTAPSLELRAGVAIRGGFDDGTRARDRAAPQGRVGSEYQVRWRIRRPWTGPVRCADPRSAWADAPEPLAAGDVAAAVRRPLHEFITSGARDGLEIPDPSDPAAARSDVPDGREPLPPAAGCSRCDARGPAEPAGLLVLAAALRRRRPRQRGPGSLA